MAFSSNSWMKGYNEAQELADDINGMISENSFPTSGPESQRHASAIRRKIAILGSRLDSLQSLLFELQGKQPIYAFRERNELSDSLLGPEKKPSNAMNRTTGLDNQGLVGLQQQIMKEQDEGLEKLVHTVTSTKHIAWAVNVELDLHTRLIDDLDEHADVTGSHLRRVQKRLAILNKHKKGGCSCICMLLSVIGIVVLVVLTWLLVKYL